VRHFDDLVELTGKLYRTEYHWSFLKVNQVMIQYEKPDLLKYSAARLIEA
jgi:hypothetical protein